MTRRATYQDVLDAPEHVTVELVDGELTLMTRPRGWHALASGRLFSQLDQTFAGGGGWCILQEVELWLGRADPQDRVLVPDLSGWRTDRHVPDLALVGHVVAPDWVTEVLSPTTARRDRLVKLHLYAEAGIRHVWIVDPGERSIEVFELRDGVFALVAVAADDAEVALVPFDAPLKVGRLWER
jgi:Uma2 family endonuclease